ncbi:RLK7 [Symbiodinium natans]|uniref:RLK7 protein n=1 Tax=Symbiodinium natans TaxID=878477 RepID=A0A812QKI9_9DINO|nr:RLK7 [Symbiodinium natans]
MHPRWSVALLFLAQRCCGIRPELVAGLGSAEPSDIQDSHQAASSLILLTDQAVETSKPQSGPKLQPTGVQAQVALAVPKAPNDELLKATLARTQGSASWCTRDVLLGALGGLGIHEAGPPCSWQGIACSFRGCVTKIERRAAVGNIEWLRNLTTLRDLILPFTQVFGDLRALSPLTRLRDLHLRSTQVTGDLKALSPLISLKALHLDGTQVSGDIAALSPLTMLHTLYLRGTQVSGDIQALSPCTLLKKLSIPESQISGDLKALAPCTRLRFLSLRNTTVSGDLKAVAPLTSLKKLHLLDTRVSGDLETLSPLAMLESLSLSHTQVTGDLQALSPLKALRRLLLRRSQVHGNLGSLRYQTKLTKLDLGSLSDVEGDLGILRNLSHLEQVYLADTGISGIFSLQWRGCCKKLRRMELAGSRVGGLLDPVDDLHFSTQDRMLPSLQTLDVRRCPLNGSVAQLLLPLAATPIASLAASGCGLHGEVPALDMMQVQIDKTIFTSWSSMLKETLHALDISSNAVTSLYSLPSTLQLDLRHNTVPLTIGSQTLAEAAHLRLDLNLEGTQLANREEVRTLLGTELELSKSRSYANETGGYICAGFTLASLHVTPDLFLPDDMCVCLQGYQGTGTMCKTCPASTFAAEEGQTRCEPCPANSSAPQGSSSLEACACEFGRPRGPEGNRSCQCDAHSALLDGHCVACSKLHLQCLQNGTVAEAALPERGYARLPAAGVFRCLDPLRCPGQLPCATGYGGPLCATCAPGHRSASNLCAACADVEDVEWMEVLKAVSLATLLLCLGVAAAYLLRSCIPPFGPGVRCACGLLASQGLVLLQLAQLWAVVARLAKLAQEAAQEAAQEDLAASVKTATDVQSDPMLTYIEILQLRGMELASFVDLQCRFDGTNVRSLAALATPLLPVVVLASCACLELCSCGTGVSMALKALAVLFVGGASGAAQLLGCQGHDGEGRTIPKEAAFRPLFPHLLCADSTGFAGWVDNIGFGSGAIYAVAVPLFLAFLFLKQKVTLQQSKTYLASAGRGKTKNEVRLTISLCNTSTPLEDNILQKRLLAAAAAYLAASVRGRAFVELGKDSVSVIRTQKDDSGVYDLSAESFIMETNKMEVETLRRNSMMQMLTERSILEEVQSDRMMIGAKQLLSKYACCNNVWMEVALKLASAVLVSVVATQDGMWLSVAVTLGMALIIGVAQPFAQPQANTLQSFCFLCLGVAAVAFAHHDRWIPRLALAAPVVLVAFQLRRPDSAEALALRLQQELEEQLPSLRRGECLQVQAEELRLF